MNPLLKRLLTMQDDGVDVPASESVDEVAALRDACRAGRYAALLSRDESQVRPMVEADLRRHFPKRKADDLILENEGEVLATIDKVGCFLSRPVPHFAERRAAPSEDQFPEPSAAPSRIAIPGGPRAIALMNRRSVQRDVPTWQCTTCGHLWPQERGEVCERCAERESGGSQEMGCGTEKDHD